MKLNCIKLFLRNSFNSSKLTKITNSNKSNTLLKTSFFYKSTTKSFSIKNKFNSGFVKYPHYSKIDKGGEDALVTHEGIICVADGVGGWAEVGVDPAKYSKELCDNIKRTFFEKGHVLFHQPKQLFIEAAGKTLSQGSATCCLCILDLEKDFLHTLNLGDSGYMILRNKKLKSPQNDALNKILKDEKDNSIEIVFRSEEQTHSFNFPFQVGTNGDDPSSADVKIHPIEENDVIILGTDGLWDNLFDEQIIKIVKPFFDVSPVLQDISLVAEMIGTTAEKYSMNQSYKSPFCVRSKGLYLGGKPDDITIIVSQVIKNN